MQDSKLSVLPRTPWGERYSGTCEGFLLGVSMERHHKAGCVPYRRTGTDTNQLELLLVSSRKHPNAWVFPKGTVEAGEERRTTAERECWEEAGIHGKIEIDLGNFIHGKTNWQMFSMLLTEVADDFPESTERQRAFFTLKEAKNRLQWRNVHISILDAFTAMVASDQPR